MNQPFLLTKPNLSIFLEKLQQPKADATY